MAVAFDADETFTNVVELDVVEIGGPASSELPDTGFDGTLLFVAGLTLASIGFIARRRHS
jgi:LPXTG-motif cell wall-anchored protein